MLVTGTGIARMTYVLSRWLVSPTFERNSRRNAVDGDKRRIEEMKHGKGFRNLNRDPAHRKAMLR